MKIGCFYLECWKIIKCTERRWSLGRKKKAALPRENKFCVQHEQVDPSTQREKCSSLMAELCERPRSEARCDISLFRYQVGRKTCLTLQINTSLREGERGHSPNQSARCQKHLGRHLAAVPFGPQRASDQSSCQEMKSARKQHKANVKEATCHGEGHCCFPKIPICNAQILRPNRILLRTIQVVGGKKAIIYSIVILHCGWAMRKLKEGEVDKLAF